MSASDLSPLEQLAQQSPQPVQQEEATPSDLSPLEQLAAMSTPKPKGPSAEEKKFMESNPNHQWVPADAAYPNRPEGVYPTGPGNDWRKDPTAAQSPIDLHFARHTAEGAAAGAAASTPAMLLGPAEAFAGTAAGKALLEIVHKYGAKVLAGGAAGVGLGIGHDAFHKAAKLLGLASDKKGD